MRSLIFTLLLLFYAPAFAAGISNIVEVNVDVTSDSAAQARTIAMNQAYRQAVKTVALNFTTNDGLKILDALTDDQLQNFIKETTVQDEKSSTVRYMARLKISVHDGILKQYLTEKEATVVTTAYQEVIVIPVFRKSVIEKPLLWEAENLWKQIWEKEKINVGTIKFRVLNERYGNILNPESVLNINNKAYEQIAAIEENENIYVLDAHPISGGQLVVNIMNPATFQTETVTIGDTNIEPADEDAENNVYTRPALEDLFIRASKEISLILSDNIKKRSAKTSNLMESVSVLYNYNSLSDWIKLQGIITDLNIVKNIEVHAIGNGKVQFEINFNGKVDELIKVMYQNYLLMEPRGNFYVITRN